MNTKQSFYFTTKKITVYSCMILQLIKVSILRVIPQETVDKHLGPDRLAGLKGPDPNYCRQPTLWLHDLCLEVLTLHGIELRLFWAKAFPLVNY